ncbi:MAG: TolC family protein [Nitrospinota bacterium]
MKTLVTLLILSIMIMWWAIASWAGSGKGFHELEKDYSENRSTPYLDAHLHEPVLDTGQEKKNRASGTIENRFKTTQTQLLNRKNDEMGLLKDSILHNGLFQPSQILWDAVKQLEDDHGFEKLLETNYSFETVLSVILANNREIKMAFEAARATLEKYGQVTNLDEILNQYSAFTKGLDMKIGKPHHNKRVNMNFPFPGMLALKGEIVNKETLIARLDLVKTVQSVLVKTNNLYQNIIFQNEAIRITEETLLLLSRLKDVVETVYSTGRSSLNDVMKIEMEIDKLQTDIAEKRDKKDALQVKLNKLLNISYEFVPKVSPKPMPQFLNYSKKDLIREGLETRIEIKGLHASLDKMKLMIAMAEKRFYPDATPGYSFFQNRTIRQVGSEAPSSAFGSRPMIRGASWFGMNDAYIRETRTKLKAMEEKLESLKNKTVDEIFTAIFRYEKAERFRKLFKDRLVPKSQITIETTEALYSTGKVDFLELIDSEQRNLKYKLSLEKAIRDLNIEAMNLARLVGAKIIERTQDGFTKIENGE